MRRLAIGLLLTVVTMCLSCDHIVVGESPIRVVIILVVLLFLALLCASFRR